MKFYFYMYRDRLVKIHPNLYIYCSKKPKPVWRKIAHSGQFSSKQVAYLQLWARFKNWNVIARKNKYKYSLHFINGFH